jgi:hypothetical protein
MSKKIALAAALVLAFTGAAQAQTTCSCDASATRTADQAALVALLTNKMVCGNVGNEVWQEWHNGTSAGQIVDYKLGPSNAVDPSTQVGTYSVANNTVTYNYTGGGSYSYEVCQGAASYTFCGQRTITGVKIGGNGLQSCATVNSVLSTAVRTLKR